MVHRNVEIYNLDVIISVGYRVNTKPLSTAWRCRPGEFHVWIAPNAAEGTPAKFILQDEKPRSNDKRVKMDIFLIKRWIFTQKSTFLFCLSKKNVYLCSVKSFLLCKTKYL